MKRLLLITALLLFSRHCFAIREFYQIHRSVRAMGMGGAIYALPDDEFALFSNPAGLAFYLGRPKFSLLQTSVHFSASALTNLQAITDSSYQSQPISKALEPLKNLESDPVHMNAGIFPFYLSRGLAMGFLFGDAKINFASIPNGNESDLDVTSIIDNGFLIGKAFYFDNGMAVGLNAKTIFRAMGNQFFTASQIAQGAILDFGTFNKGGSAILADLDLGFIYHMPSPIIGRSSGVSLTFSNILSDLGILYSKGTPIPDLVRSLSWGMYADLSSYLRVRLDLSEFRVSGSDDKDLSNRGDSFLKHLHFGAEMPLFKSLHLRAGFNQLHWTAGLGFQTNRFSFQFATYGEELGETIGERTSRRYGIQVRFNFDAGQTKAGVGKRAASKDPVQGEVTAGIIPAPQKGIFGEYMFKRWGF